MRPIRGWGLSMCCVIGSLSPIGAMVWQKDWEVHQLLLASTGSVISASLCNASTNYQATHCSILQQTRPLFIADSLLYVLFELELFCEIDYDPWCLGTPPQHPPPPTRDSRLAKTRTHCCELAEEQWLEVSMAGTSSSAYRPIEAPLWPCAKPPPPHPPLINPQGGCQARALDADPFPPSAWKLEVLDHGRQRRPQEILLDEGEKDCEKMCFHPMCLCSIYSEFSGEINNGQKWACFQSTQNDYPISDQWFIRDA